MGGAILAPMISMVRPLLVLISALMSVGLSGGSCTLQRSWIQTHQETLDSLSSTTVAIGRAWLAGDVSETFTRIALQRTFVLVEHERRALAATPQALLDSREAHLSDAADRLARILAMMISDVAAADAGAIRRRLTDVPLTFVAPR